MLSLELIGDESGSGSESLDSVTESQNSSQISVKRKRVNGTFRTQIRGLKFLDNIQADVLACDFEERKRKLIEHFQTRTPHDRPICEILCPVRHNLCGFETSYPASGQIGRASCRERVCQYV